jgi:hypothetical protein
VVVRRDEFDAAFKERVIELVDRRFVAGMTRDEKITVSP